jgi:immune inhibitor A
MAVAVMVGVVASAHRAGPPPSKASASRAGLEVVPMEPRTAAEMKAKGMALPTFIGTSINKGKKFNPTGGSIPALTTDATQKVLVLFVQFTDTPPGGPATRADLHEFDDLLFGTTYDPPAYSAYASTNYPIDRTLKNYFEEATFGKVDIVTLNLPSSLSWLQSGHSYSYYCAADGVHDNGFGPYPQNAQGLVIDAVKAADSQVDFSQYARNGVVPNLFVVHAGTGAEWSTDPSIIWSHSWDLSEGTGLNGYVADGVKINSYAMMPEVGGDTTAYYQPTASGPYPATVGVYAHEYGHVLGLPDQYDYGYESNGTGYFSLMAGGSWNNWPEDEIFYGNSPSELDAWSKYRLGVLTPTKITSSTTVTLPPSETNAVAYKMVVPGSGGKEYFLFENRQNIGFDEGLLDWYTGPTIKSIHGLAVYHVDDTVFSRNYDRPNEAENWKEFRSVGWRKAWTGERHYAISILQADDRWDLEHGYNQADVGDLYPGSRNVRAVGNRTFPNTSSYYFWLGNEPKYGYSGVTAKNITESGMQVTVTFSFVPYPGTP